MYSSLSFIIQNDRDHIYEFVNLFVYVFYNWNYLINRHVLQMRRPLRPVVNQRVTRIDLQMFYVFEHKT